MVSPKNPIAVITFLSALALFAAPVPAQSLSAVAEREAEIDALLEELAQPDLRTWEAVEQKIFRLWSQSGSDTADLLLKRGQEAIEAEDYTTAIEHLTALIDHAPDFAEGWHTRATVFYNIGEYGLAMADIQRALALNPRHFGALMGVGIILEETGDYPLALRALRMASALNPHRENIREAIERLEYLIGESTL